jgi:hypothetical protein
MTPELRLRKSWIDSRSASAGAASSARSAASRKRPHVPQTMTATMARLTTGSSHVQPVRRITPAATMTPTEMPASPAMCRKTPRTFKSCSRPRANISAVIELMMTPTPAVAMTSSEPTPSGFSRRLTASSAIPPETKIRTTPFARAASTVALPKP